MANNPDTSTVTALLKKAAETNKSEDAMRFSQAANNAANALVALSALTRN